MVAVPDNSDRVDTIDDVLRILRERPDVREAVRREILTDELLQLPEKVAEIITVQKQILERMDRQDELLGDHGEQLRDHGRQLSNLNGWATMLAAERRFAVIAIEMGLAEPRLLPIEDLALMSVSNKASEYTHDELNSFRDCDIVISARNADGDECYVTVQVATTVDHSDITRAIKHAEMVTHFTGRPAYPAVAGFESVRLADQRLAGDSIHWHRMRPRDRNPR